MNRPFARPHTFAQFMLAALLTLSAYALMAQDTATEEPDAIIIATSEPFEMMFGSGPFDLFSTTQGLSDLSSYRATLTVSFEGTNAGQPEQWSRTYTMLVTQTPPARQLTIENSEDAIEQVYMAEINSAVYERQDEVCIAYPVETAGASANDWEPAEFLDSVIGADEAGTETVNDVATNHYTFDESAIGAAGIAESTGALWIAADGGYVVRYLLTTTGSADYFGEGVDATVTWDYQLSDINQPLLIEIPEDCPPLLLDVALMPDAADLVQMPGFTTYTTASSMEEVVTFYEEQVTTSGGLSANPPLFSEGFALFGFTQNDLPMLIIASNDGGDTSVQIQQMNDPAELAISAEVPDSQTEEVVVDNPPQDCEGGDIPILPDATDVQNMMGLISYTTSMSVGDAVAYYEEQVLAQGGQVSSPIPATNAMAMLNVQQGGQALMVSINSMGGSNNVTIASMTGSPLSLPDGCG